VNFFYPMLCHKKTQYTTSGANISCRGKPAPVQGKPFIKHFNMTGACRKIDTVKRVKSFVQEPILYTIFKPLPGSIQPEDIRKRN
jgi:hypothetical protein